MARGWIAGGPPCGKNSQEIESFVLRTYIVGEVGVKKFHMIKG